MLSVKTRALPGAALVALAGIGAAGAFAASSTASPRAAASAVPTPPLHLSSHRLRPRHGAIARGTVVRSSSLFGNRVFANSRDGFALAEGGMAQYPARTTDGGRTWLIDGPQVHVDAADAPEAVSSVGVAGAHTFFTYGSSVIDATSDGGRTWWQTFPDGFVAAVAPGRFPNELVAYVQQSVGNTTVTWQYVTRDGGRHWAFSTAMGG